LSLEALGPCLRHAGLGEREAGLFFLVIPFLSMVHDDREALLAWEWPWL
jgi:hypothetical protein